jgi:molybdopterin-guanine dinucleotide biosynthesis protein A
MSEVVLGVFVGGRGLRLGGVPKGLLAHPTEATSLVGRAVRLGRELGAHTVLVGQNEAYAPLGLPMLADAPQAVGPLGGLAALLGYAAPRDVLALACDMPFVPLELLRRLLATPGGAAVVACRSTGREPLCALYRTGPVAAAVSAALAEGRYGLRGVLDRVAVCEVLLVGAEERWLDDWDVPADLAGS